MSVPISILMCVQNGHPYIEQAVKSILTQNYTAFQFVIVDDCSDDGTLEYLRECASHDSRILLIIRRFKNDFSNKELKHNEVLVIQEKSPHGGQTDSLNIGARYCNGKYIARMDADDMSLPNRLLCQVNLMESDDNLALACSSALRIDESGNVFGKYYAKKTHKAKIYRMIRRGQGKCAASTWIIRANVFKALGYYHPEGHRAEDLDFLLRITELGDNKIAFDPTQLIKLRFSESSLTQSSGVGQLDYAIMVLAAHILRQEGVKIDNDSKNTLLNYATKIIEVSQARQRLAARRDLLFAVSQLVSQKTWNETLKFVGTIIRVGPIILSDAIEPHWRLELAKKVAHQYKVEVDYASA